MRRILFFALALILCLAACANAYTLPPNPAVKPQLIQVAPKLVGQLYLPDEKSEYKHIGLLVMHPNTNFFNHPIAVPMAERGFTVMVSNTRYTDTGEDIFWDDVALDKKAAVEYLKALPGIEKVIFIGHSGGGPLAAFYQNIAENGAKAGQGKEKIFPVGDELDGLPKADGLVLIDSHLGYGFTSLVTKDPSVVAEGALGPEKIDDSFNMYLEKNGLSAQGPKFDEWKKKYYAAQVARNQRVLAYALERYKAIDKGDGMFPDDEPMVIPRNYARLWDADLRVLSHTKEKYPFLTVNGIREEVVRCMRVQGINKSGQLSGVADNLSYSDGTLVTSVRNYLSTYSIRADSDFHITEDDIIGVDFASSNTSAPTNLEGVHVPVLLVGMTNYYCVVMSEINYNHAATGDKTLVYVEGTTHSLTPAKPEYGDTVGMIADYTRDWIVERFK